jgi:hypothetical protein
VNLYDTILAKQELCLNAGSQAGAWEPGQKSTMNLWSNDPLERLLTARQLSSSMVTGVQSALIESSPMKPWPYGMPTAVNPFLIILGPSPGNSPVKGDADFITRPAYEVPTVGYAHPKFLYPSTYWDKARELSVGLIQAYAPELSPEDCYALSGQMNLGVGALGQANEAAIEIEYAKWVPKVIAELLKPRLVIVLGLVTIMKQSKNLQKAFVFSGAMPIDWKRPDLELPFRYYTDKRMVYRIWKLSRPDGTDMTVISWPNHPSRSPMTNAAVWHASIDEAVQYVIDCEIITTFK